jgi:hypothetical protein
VSPRCTRLYRKARWAVILAASGLLLALSVQARFAGGKTAKGPRALGLVELAHDGKVRLIPITILYDGQFYDASAYKAAPVPMSLESGTVYEAVRNGVSQGLFTVTGALQARNTWIGLGTWQSASAVAAAAEAAAKKKAALSKTAPEPVEGPPVLRRAGAERQKPSEPVEAAPPAATTPAATPPAPATPPASPPATTSASTAPAVTPDEDDPNRPVLRRGLPPPEKPEKKQPATPVLASAKSEPARPTAKATPSSLEFIPAISDAGGPDPRPYGYSMKPEEEQKLRRKILALAADEVRSGAAQLAGESAESASPTPRSSSKPGTGARLPQPAFEEVQLRAFDLSNSNEPILVLSAKASMPGHPKDSSTDLRYLLTMVVRNDINGDLHKAFVSITDTQHLDVLPRLDLIDAVDADGDGRGELLFRQVSDAGSAFVLYRVIGDRLWPLFQGTPGQ